MEEKVLNDILEKTLDYYLNNLRSSIKESYNKLDSFQKKFNYVIELAEQVGYEIDKDSL